MNDFTHPLLSHLALHDGSSTAEISLFALGFSLAVGVFVVAGVLVSGLAEGRASLARRRSFLGTPSSSATDLETAPFTDWFTLLAALDD